jgi:hypothetical protein
MKLSITTPSQADVDSSKTTFGRVFIVRLVNAIVYSLKNSPVGNPYQNTSKKRKRKKKETSIYINSNENTI